MTCRQYSLLGGRTLIFGSLDMIDRVFPRPLAALLPAFEVRPQEKIAAIAGKLFDLGCVEICCVGPLSEQLHDRLDDVVEEKGWLEIVTTWDTDLYEGCEHFLFAAGGRPPTLLALITSRPELVILLEELKIDA